MIAYQGPSRITQEEIVLILTGLDYKTQNTKTGNMIQSWIFDTRDTPYNIAISGQDSSVCGNCKHSPKNLGSCYVNLGQGPHQVYLKFKRGGYPVLDYHYRNLKKLFEGRKIRIGSYGNPSAIPLPIWRKILKYSDGHTGYDHEWSINKRYQKILMASVDSEQEKDRANRLGWRTFRVKSPTDKVLPDEVVCPASAEAGYKTSCEKCLLCSGNSIRAKNIVINAHGKTKKRFLLSLV